MEEDLLSQLNMIFVCRVESPFQPIYIYTYGWWFNTHDVCRLFKSLLKCQSGSWTDSETRCRFDQLNPGKFHGFHGRTSPCVAGKSLYWGAHPALFFNPMGHNITKIGDRWLGGSVQEGASNGIFPIKINWGAKELLRVSRSHESCVAWFDNDNLTFCFILIYYLIFQDTNIPIRLGLGK